MKTCPKCKSEKPLRDYHKCKRNKDGRQTQCKTCRRADRAESRAENQGRIRKQRAEYYAENRDRERARVADYQAANPHVKWESNSRSRAKHYGYAIVIESFTREDLIAQWGDECFHCKGEWTELDHFPVPLSKGGHHIIENCRPSCVKCNRPGRVRRLNKTDIGETA